MGKPSHLKNDCTICTPTRRTETSKYPVEKKTIVIPPVVASEKGTAQTNNVKALLGL